MKVKRVVITAPKKESGKWKVSMFGSKGKHRASANTAFQLVEKDLNVERDLISEARLKEKTCVKVKYGDGSINESLCSNQPRYLLFCLTCFLEDYPTKQTLKKKYKKYEPEE